MGWFRRESKSDEYARTAIATFVRLAPSAPVIDEAQRQSEYESLSSLWRGPSLISGSLDYITVVVQENILRDASLADYGGTVVKVLDKGNAIQVNSVFAAAGGGGALAYRVWRTPERYALFSSYRDMIVPERNAPPPLTVSFQDRWVAGLGQMLGMSAVDARSLTARARKQGLEPEELRTTSGGVRFVVFRGDDAEAAKRFLRLTVVEERALQYIVETPAGTWGIDIGGLYLEDSGPGSGSLHPTPLPGP